MHHQHRHPFTPTPSLSDLLDELSAGCDPDFDAAQEEVERQFAELRLAFDHH
ncbi:MAG: hypothetical protein K2X87_08290 [Gemmataceae bacterium]|nr:hypothetical protein [Gemmataceae bacterium]